MSDEIKVCPECGKDVSTLNVSAHSESHWPEFLDPAKSSKEARARQKMLLSGGVTVEVYNALHTEE